jgi:hypothetical protein
MSRLGTAFGAFFQSLFRAGVAERVARALRDEPVAIAPPPTPTPAPAPNVAPSAPKPPVRSDALTLLSALQREARLVDFLQEPIADYADAQIGAAVRDIHRDCGKVLERMFALQPLVDAAEGSPLEVAGESDEYRLVGKVGGSPPFKGTLVHPGWVATKCEIPAWTGNVAAAKVVAPAEVEMG